MAAVASTGRLQILERADAGESCSIELLTLWRDVLGEAAGESGAVGPYLEFRLDIDDLSISVNNGS